MSTRLESLAAYEQEARSHMSDAVWKMVFHGSADEWSTNRLRPAMESGAVWPRRLRGGAGSLDLSTTILGDQVSMPVGPSAPATKYYAHPDGEVAVARAAARMGCLHIIPHMAHYDVAAEEIAAANGNGVRWLQLYVLDDRGATRSMIERAEATGCSALVLTVSAPSAYNAVARDVDDVSGVYADKTTPYPPVPEEFVFDTTIDWSILEWIAEVTSLPVVIKGIISAADARLAADCGAAGIMVSAHGSRLFDGTPAPIEVVPRVADVVGDRCEVYLDGGVRSGVDILRACSRGARACFLGKPLFYSLAVGGEDGVYDMFSVLRDELEVAMASSGLATIAEADADLTSWELGVPR